MYRSANARTELSQRNKRGTVLIRGAIAATFLGNDIRSGILLLGGAIALIATSAFAQTHAAPAGDPADLDALSRDQNQWVMAPRDYANTRFSGLDQINTGDAAQLRVGWTFSLGADRGQEAAPLIVNNTMYVTGPYAGPHPNQVFALDATTGDLKWSYAPKPDTAAQGVACCDVVTRGLAYDQGKVFLNTLDNYSVAIDANSGKELWHTKLGDINEGQTITVVPCK
jgi:glucose dehydrogenase